MEARDDMRGRNRQPQPQPGKHHDVSAQVGSLLHLLREAQGRQLSPGEAEAIAVLTDALRPLLGTGGENG